MDCREITLTKCEGKWIDGGKPRDSNLRLAREDSFEGVGIKDGEVWMELRYLRERTDRPWWLPGYWELGKCYSKYSSAIRYL